jgi:hypothetical protein
MSSFDRSKSLQELEQHDWGEPTYHSSLVTTCHCLTERPLLPPFSLAGDFSTDKKDRLSEGASNGELWNKLD